MLNSSGNSYFGLRKFIPFRLLMYTIALNIKITLEIKLLYNWRFKLAVSLFPFKGKLLPFKVIDVTQELTNKMLPNQMEKRIVWCDIDDFEP